MKGKKAMNGGKNKIFIIALIAIAGIFFSSSCQSPVTPDVVGEKSIAVTSVNPKNLILNVSPSNEAYYTPQESKIVVIFERKMDLSTINESTFKVFSSEAEVPGIVSNETSANFRSTFTPKQNLSLSTQYTAVLTDGLKDSTGNITKTSYKWTFTTTTETGVAWVRATASAEFPARMAHSSVVTPDNKMWIIGGINLANFTNYDDIWSSSDGIKWGKIVPITKIFSERAGHASIYFKNKIWVIGGLKIEIINDVLNQTYYNDVWSSSDGKSWEKVTQTAEFAARAYHSVAEKNGKLWLIGGTSGNNSEISYKDIWASEDGKNWGQVIPQTDTFSERGGHSCINFDNNLLVIGGAIISNNVIIYRKDVLSLSSSDGSSWTEMVKNAGFPDESAKAIKFKNKVWVVGEKSDFVWNSLDGKTWSKINVIKYFNSRLNFTLTEFQNKIWVIGGSDGTNYFNDVWYTQ